MVQRRFKRKQVALSCEFWLVQIQEIKSGRKSEKKMVVSPQKYRGTIMDISIGGCALKTGSTIQAGSRLKIAFENIDGQRIAALGQVIRTNRSGGTGIILHTKFLKIPQRGQNAINAMVFEYDQD